MRITENLSRGDRRWLLCLLFGMLLFAALFAGAATAQKVAVANYTAERYEGWTTVSTARAETLDWSRTTDPDGEPILAVPGRRVGLHGRMVHLRLALEPSEVWSGDLADLDPVPDDEREAVAIPPDIAADPIGTLGRPVLGGVPLPLVELQPDGPGFLCHFSGRLTDMLQAELWVQWYPRQPWAPLELLVIASNAESAKTEAVLSADLTLDWSPGHVQMRGAGEVLLPAGEHLGDGQGRAWAGTVFWTGRMTTEDWQSAGAWAQLPMLGMGDWRGRFGTWGVPAELPPGFDVARWTRQYVPGEMLKLNSWREGQLGVAARSSQTGGQEDQGFVKASEAFAPGGTGAWWARYPAALGFVRRPCHHLEADGRPINLNGHPKLVFWSGRPHWHTGVSPDQLGLPAGASIDWHGWYGPDRGHWWLNTVGAVRLLSGSPAIDYLLQHQARLFWFQQTVNPNLSTSHAGTARSVGEEGWVACWLWQTLDNRSLAELVKGRFIDRVNKVLVPELDRTGMVVQRWDPRDDARLWEPIDRTRGYTRVWMSYQQAVGACGLEMAGQMFGLPQAREIARQGALAVVNYGYSYDEPSGLWLEWDFVAERSPGEPLRPEEYVEGVGAHRTGWFRHAWSPMASWTVLRHDPQHARAKAIYEQIHREMLGRTDRALDWLPPR